MKIETNYKIEKNNLIPNHNINNLISLNNYNQIKTNLAHKQNYQKALKKIEQELDHKKISDPLELYNFAKSRLKEYGYKYGGKPFETNKTISQNPVEIKVKNPTLDTAIISFSADGKPQTMQTIVANLIVKLAEL